MEKKLSEMDFDEEGTVKEIDENLKKQVAGMGIRVGKNIRICLLYTSPSPRDAHESRMPSSA